MRVGTIRLVAIAAGLSALGLVAVGVQAEDYGPFKEQKTKAGNVLADAKGMTLYTYDKDKSGESACTGKCAEVWPPAKASASDKASGDFTVIKRPDGTMQWADDGKPLYTYQDDKKAGEANGDGKGGVWHAAKAE
jgi:predicted lipoprotein with Yx(FWY)xxD motif